MKLELNSNDIQLLSLKEVAEQLMNGKLDNGERIGEVRLECGVDLEIDIEVVVEDDPRCSSYHEYTETYTLGDIRSEFEAADYYCWAKDENGNDVLACFGC